MTSTSTSIPALLLLAILSGCVSNTPRLDRQFGTSVKAAARQQVLNPNAAANPNAVAGMDGQAAKSAYANYQESFKDPKPQAGALTIGVAK